MELYHYGVKGMKWHQHRMARDDDDGSGRRRSSLLDGFAAEAQRLQNIANEAQSVQAPAEKLLTNPSKENLQRLWDTYNHISPEARDMVNSFVASQIKAFGADVKQNWYKYAAQGMKQAGKFAVNKASDAIPIGRQTTYNTVGHWDSQGRRKK